jgi:hypothetical protein
LSDWGFLELKMKAIPCPGHVGYCPVGSDIVR